MPQARVSDRFRVGGQVFAQDDNDCANLKYSTRARGRKAFGQSNCVFPRESDKSTKCLSPLKCSATQIYVEIAQCREWFKTGSSPVGRPFQAQGSSEPGLATSPLTADTLGAALLEA